MELTRRDALAALGAAGVTAAGGAALTLDALDAPEFGEHERDTLVALARVVYPSAVEGVPEFVERYVVGRVRDRPEHAAGAAGAVATLDARANDWFGADAVDLAADDRDALLRQAGLDAADPDPDGDTAQRLRYYLVNDLLFALYSSPTGGELVGIENPQGHPGGTDSYRRGP